MYSILSGSLPTLNMYVPKCKLVVSVAVVMTICKGELKKLVIKVNRCSLEQVMEFRYLGSLTAEDNRCHAEIRSRIKMAKNAFIKKQELVKNSLSNNLKKDDG